MDYDFEKDVTDGDINGSGMFDITMRSISAHLQKEYGANRIRDEDYSTVYLGALESALGQAVQFIVGKEQAAAVASQAWTAQQKSAAEIALIEQKTVTELGQVTEVEHGLIGRQQDVLSAEILLTESKVIESAKNNELIDKKILSEDAQTNDITEGILGKQQSNLVAEGLLINQKYQSELGQVTNMTDGLIGKEQALADKKIEQSSKEIELMTQKILTERGQVEDVADGIIGQQLDTMAKEREKIQKEMDYIAQKIATEEGQTNHVTDGIIGKQLNVMDEQINKSQAEIALLAQKKTTEEGQVTDLTTGTIGRQQALYAAQEQGFYRDAEQKLAKIMADNYSVRRGTNDVEPVELTGMTSPEIKEVLAVAKAGIGMPPP